MHFFVLAAGVEVGDGSYDLFEISNIHIPMLPLRSPCNYCVVLVEFLIEMVCTVIMTVYPLLQN